MPTDDLLTDPLIRDVPVREGYKVLGSIVLYQKLGQGGMGAVYRGKHLRMGIDVAVKVMAPPVHLSQDARTDFVKRFLREARVALSVIDSRLIRVFTAEADSNVYYLVMDYVEGETAGDRLKRKGPLSEGEALRICTEAAEGLAAAHCKGIVHRDVKPDNILIGKDGSVRVIDLGLAKAFGDTGEHTDTSELTQSHRAIGTPQYMSLEQFESARDVGPPADVWSLGVTLYHLLTGELPWSFTGVLGFIASVQRDPPADIETHRPDVSPGLRSILRKSIEKDLSKRYADCGEMLDAMRALVTGLANEATCDLTDQLAGTTRHVLVAGAPPDEPHLTTISQSLASGAGAGVDTEKMPAAGPRRRRPSTKRKPEARPHEDSAVVLAQTRWLKIITAALGILIVGAVVAAVTVSVPRGDGYAKHMDTAAKALTNRQWKSAIASYEKALEIRSGDESAKEGIGAARRGEMVAFLESTWASRNGAYLRKALTQAKGLVADDTYLLYTSRLQTLEDIPRIDDMLKRRRYARALAAVNERLDAGPHPNDIKKKLDSQHRAATGALESARQLLAKGKSYSGSADVDKLQTGVDSLKRFTSLFPDHADLPEAKRLLNGMSDTIAARLGIHVNTVREGHACYVDGIYVGPTNTTLSRRDIASGRHTVKFVDDDGFASTHTFEVTEAGQSKRLFDHGSAVAPEREAYGRVVVTSAGKPEDYRAACIAYLERFPNGAKREEVERELTQLQAKLAAALSRARATVLRLMSVAREAEAKGEYDAAIEKYYTAMEKSRTHKLGKERLEAERSVEMARLIRAAVQAKKDGRGRTAQDYWKQAQRIMPEHPAVKKHFGADE